MRLLLAWSLFAAAVLAADPIEYLENGGFEVIGADLLPMECKFGGRGAMAVTTEAHGGKVAIQVVPAGPGDFDPKTNVGEYNAVFLGGSYALGQAVPIDRRAKYRWSVWARGTGRIRLNTTQASTVFLRSWFGPDFTVTDQWQKYEAIYQASDDPRICQAVPTIQIVGPGNVYLDDASFQFVPADNPGIELARPVARDREVILVTRSRDARLTVLLDGVAVPLAKDRATLTLPEGLHAIGLSATATGPNPGIAAELVDHPQTAARWRLTATPADGWQATDFDDAKWPLANGDLMWVDGAESVAARQTILWNATHYGLEHCLAPKVKVWGFPRNGTEIFILGIVNPRERGLNGEFQFVFDLPRGFRLLDKMGYDPRWIMNIRPEEMTTAVVRRPDGQMYTRYTMNFKDRRLEWPQLAQCELPVVMDQEPDLDDLRFYYRRSLAGNVTELENSVPIRILPAIRGKMPEKIVIHLFNSMPTYCSVEQREAMLATGTRAGMNTFSFHPNPGWKERHRRQEQLWYEGVLRHGARFSLWLTVPLPYPSSGGGHLNWFPDWLESHPEAHDRYYQGQPEWGSDRYRATGYCPAYALSDDSAEFWDVVEREFDRYVDAFPKLAMVWYDFEYHVLSPDGKGSGGFTDRNKELFREWGKLPADIELTDETIVGKYRGLWEAFRHWENGRIIAKMHRIWNRKGIHMMLYVQGADPLWEELAYRVDLAFPGTPGDSPADSYYQGMLDNAARHMREELDFPHVVGQRFSSHFMREWQPGLGFSKPLSHSGLTEPATWKAQIVRIVASLGGGVDLTNVQSWGGGSLYYIGEATRLISTYEDLFYAGKRDDALAVSTDIASPNLFVLRQRRQRLVLLFNEADTPREVTLTNKDLPPAAVARVYDTDEIITNPETLTLTIPPQDVLAVHLWSTAPNEY